eukprot:s1553_g10.t2
MQGQDVVGEGMHNAVSILQEHVQSCSDFPPHARILMWNFENRIQEDSLLQFRAVVSFIFKEVPHFFRGSWQTSKKKAQRDTASGSVDSTLQVPRFSVPQMEKEEPPSSLRSEGSDLDAVVTEVVQDFPDGSASWISIGHVQRMLRATEGDEELAVKKLKDSVVWKRDTLDGWLQSQAESLPTAETRVIAIGQESRPLVYSGCVNQRRGEVAGVILACVWHKALEEAGPTAQMDYVLDAHGYQPLLNLNFMPYLNVAGSLNSYFAERFHRIVLLDVPTVMSVLMKAILPVLPQKTREKLFFVRRDQPDSLSALHDLCVNEGMKEMLQQLLRMNGEATSSDGREATRLLTSKFLASQRARPCSCSYSEPASQAERVRRYMSRNDSQSGLQAPQGPALTLDELVQQELCHMRDTRQTSRSWQGEHVDGEVEDRLSAVGQEFRMVLCFELNRVPHQFAGAWCTSVSDAVSDAAQRVLWYFGLGTGFQGTSLSTTAQAAEPLPPQLLSPKEIGTSPGASVGSEPRHPVEDKTILMQVQNMLQKTFSKDTAAGEKVWVWTYEPSPADPQVFRAIAQVPAIGRTFQGDWCRGKKFAQRNACLAVKAFLEEQGVSDVP